MRPLGTDPIAGHPKYKAPLLTAIWSGYRHK